MKTLTIYCMGAGKDGQHTLRFNNVRNINLVQDNNNSYLEFEYTSASTGLENTGRFYMRNISGYSCNY